MTKLEIKQIKRAIETFECGFISAYELFRIIKTIVIKTKTDEKK
jgi:hypothetical protein